MKKFILATFAIVVIILACDGVDLPSGGGDVSKLPAPEAPPPPRPVPPRVDEPFDWNNTWGYSAFALGGWPPEHIERIVREGLSKGWNTPRVCAETEFWDDEGFLKRVPRNIDKVDTLLDTIARIPDAQVLLIANCTLKGPVPIAEQKEWAREVARLIVRKNYKNVAVEAVNESWNCRGRGWGPYCPSRGDVIDMIRDIQDHRISQVGDDDHICIGEAGIQHRMLGIANFYSFHPCRNDANGPWDPNRNFIQRMSEANWGARVVLSETVAYSETSDGGLRTRDKGRIQRYIEECKAAGNCVFFYHSDFGLEAKEYPWWPTS